MPTTAARSPHSPLIAKERTSDQPPPPTYPLSIYDEDGLLEFAQEGIIETGALLTDDNGHRWLAYDLEGTVMVARPPTNEECPQDTSHAIYRAAKTLPFPLTVLVADRPSAHLEYGNRDVDEDDGPFDVDDLYDSLN